MDDLRTRLENLVKSLRARARHFRLQQVSPMIPQELDVVATALEQILQAPAPEGSDWYEIARFRALDIERLDGEIARLEAVAEAASAALGAAAVKPGPEWDQLVDALTAAGYE